MIDLHSHILPAIDDGASDLEEARAMARLATSDGITVMACTPHIVPGLYENTTTTITAAVDTLQNVFHDDGINLELVVGADVRIAPGLLTSIKSGCVPTLNGSRYFLFEPTHNVLPPRIELLSAQLIDAGYIPILTHPERLSWIRHHYETVVRLSALGCLLQITGGSVIGAFGNTARKYAEQLMDEGLVDILASDAHNTTGRPPVLSKARDAVAERLGEKEAEAMVVTRPADILADRPLVTQKRNVARQNLARRAAAKKGYLGGMLSKWIRGGWR